MSSTSNNSHIFEKQFCDEYSIWKFYHREKQDKELAGPVPEVLSKENRDISAKMTKDLAIVGRGGARSSTLELCYKNLLTIPPTSVESERTFSSSGNFATKISSRLNDHSLDCLCFLRAYFIASKNATSKS